MCVFFSFFCVSFRITFPTHLMSLSILIDFRSLKIVKFSIKLNLRLDHKNLEIEEDLLFWA